MRIFTGVSFGSVLCAPRSEGRALAGPSILFPGELFRRKMYLCFHGGDSFATVLLFKDASGANVKITQSGGRLSASSSLTMLSLAFLKLGLCEPEPFTERNKSAFRTPGVGEACVNLTLCLCDGVSECLKWISGVCGDHQDRRSSHRPGA